MELGFVSATELVRAMRARTLSSRELLEFCLSHVEVHNPPLNAVVTLDAERATAAANEADAATVRGGRPIGPLHGLPITVKDVWETAGLLTTSGAPELREHVPTTDAIAVGRLKAAGAIIFGKTNTPLYAGDLQTYNEVFGVTNNPWDPSRTVGGSSGGAAAAVAAGLTSLELGSDIGGSIRNPAHFNGVYGLKPSWGVVPSRGHIPGPPGSLLEPDVNCNGPLARNVADLRLALDVLAGPLPEDAAAWRLELEAGPPVRSVAELRIASVVDDGRDLVPVAGDVAANLDRFTDRLAEAGARVSRIPLPVPLYEGLRSWQDLVLPIIGIGLGEEDFAAMTELDTATGDDLAVNAGRALVFRYRSWARANDLRQRQRAAWASLFDDFDVVLAPVMPTTAFPHDTTRPFAERTILVDGTAVPHLLAMAWCGAVGVFLLPVVTLPTGCAADGLPVGVQVIGPFLSDRRLLHLAGVIDEVAGPGFEPPPL